MHRQIQRQPVSEVELELLGAALKAGQSSFLVKYNDRFRWAIICLDSLAKGQLRFYFTMFATTEVTFSAVILPGTQGAQRTLFVKHPVSQKIVCAKYIRFVDEPYIGDTPIAHFLFEVRVTGEQLNVPITEILSNFPSNIEKGAFDAVTLHECERSSLAEKADNDFKHELEKSEAKIELREEIAKQQTRFPMALPRTLVEPVVYPFFDKSTLRVLFLLCIILDIEFKSSYAFNLLVVRLLACGSQERFQEDIPIFSSEYELKFHSFSSSYYKFFMGTAMTSRTLRCSKLTVQEVFLAQFEIAKANRIQAQCALKIPHDYFTGAEPGVETRESKHLIPHSFLEKLE